MKFGIIIQDLDAAQAANILEQLSGGENISVTRTGGNEGEFDSQNMPWDERIHAGTKSKNADGRWKGKKGVDEATRTAVEAELKSKAPSPGLSATLDRLEQQVGIQPAPTAPVAAPVAPVVVAPQAPVAPPVASPVAAPVAQAPITRDFKGLMQQISNLFAAKSIDPNYPGTIVQRVNAGFGVTIATITDVANDARYVEYAWQCLEVDGKAA